jgi:acyl-CoA thioester hydrolase
MPESLGRYPVSVEIPVAWGEMDAFQHVNNVAFARWVETGRVAYLTRLGLMQRVESEGVGPIVARLAIDYHRPLRYPDSVRLDVTTRSIGRTSLHMGYRIWSTRLQVEAATAEDVVVMLDYRVGRPCPVDETLRAAILALEAMDPVAVGTAVHAE